MPQLLIVPKGTDAAKCPRGCGATVYWIEKPRGDGKKGIVRVPVDTSTRDGSEPDSMSPGRGVNHFTLCPVAE